MTPARAMTWDGIASAVDAGEHERALDGALAAWRARRDGRLADLVDVLGSSTPTEPLSANGAKAFQAAWLARADRATPAMLGGLLATLTRSIPMPPRPSWEEGSAAARFAAWSERVEALSNLPDDPRIAAALFDVVRRAPWSSHYPSETAAAHAPALRLIERIGDERLIAPMRSLVDTPTASRQTTRRYLSSALPAVIGALEDVRSRRQPLDPAERERCERIIEQLGGRVRAERGGLGGALVRGTRRRRGRAFRARRREPG